MKSALSDTKWSAAAWALALAATLTLLVGAVLPPFVGSAAAVLRAGFAPLCHQLAERSFAVGGVPFAVCHRCTGIYLGLALGVLALPALRDRANAWARYDRWLLLAATLPAAIDWTGDVLGLWTNTVAVRVVTGVWFGVAAGFVFARSVSARTTAPAGISDAARGVGP
ncbi:MAG: DUF2085 domain-containing protein [Rhodothermales bacterium]